MHRLYHTLRDLLLYHLNDVLDFLVTLLDSETLDQLRVRYGNWYNLQLIQSLINYEHVSGKKVTSFSAFSMDTMDDLGVVQVYFQGRTRANAIKYLTNCMDGYFDGQGQTVQIRAIDDNHAKIIFPF